MLKTLTEQLTQARSLTAEQVTDAVAQLIDEAVSTESKAEFLTALAEKGETTDEIAAFARELRAKSIKPPLDLETRTREILDVCGTGGDRLNTFNISTTVALVCAAAGITVAKHGNRAITSQAGSADVLEALGIPIELSPERAAESLREHRFAFFFAPKYHPAFKHITPARKLCAGRGQRTIFNFLGPLLNPARPTAQLIGVPQPELCEPIAHVLQSLQVRRGMVVCGTVPFTVESPESRTPAHASRLTPHATAYLDEFSTLGSNTVAEFYQDRGFTVSELSPEQFPLQSATLADLAGGDRKHNALIVRNILSGEERGPKRGAVLLNAAAALFVAGKTKSMIAGWDLAVDVIDSGKAEAKLKELQAG
ncbi:MAG: anthranilate phosphoribosyltransferase [Verrucomicrobia bacterium]|nr:anthranilate phosphoribosyltransferase [Verrucomicrobiota bacterium]